MGRVGVVLSVVCLQLRIVVFEREDYNYIAMQGFFPLIGTTIFLIFPLVCVGCVWGIRIDGVGVCVRQYANEYVRAFMTFCVCVHINEL